MPRIARVVAEGLPHHVTQRGNARRARYPSGPAAPSHTNISQVFIENTRLTSSHPFSPSYNGAGMKLSSIQPWRRPLASLPAKHQTNPFSLPTQTKGNHLYHPATKPLGHSRRRPTLTRAQQPALRGQRLDAVFQTNRHTQARRDAFPLDAPCVPPAQVREQRHIRDRQQRQQDCIPVHVSISSRTRSFYQGCR